jgi:hypothetical protein
LPIRHHYTELKDGEWKLRVLVEAWSEELWRAVSSTIARQPANKHPQTVRLEPAGGETPPALFLKIFHPPAGIDAVKDFCRGSRAARFLHQVVALSAAGFFVPTVLAAGEERKGRRLKRAFVLTWEISGEAVPVFLRNRYEGSNALPAREKRLALESLGHEIRRLHDAGFVHGDLVPSNIFVACDPGGGFRFYLMDHDRTRRYPKWLAQSLWQRNLVQLNRFPLPGITLQDRIRFFRTYSQRSDWSIAERERLSRLERKTRERRKECDAVDPTGSFRRLMSWKGDLTAKA